MAEREITPEMMTEAAKRVGFDPVPGKLTRLAGVLNAMLAGGATPPTQAPSEAEQVCHQAYAALGPLLFDLAERGHPQAEKLMDNLSEARLVHGDVLPFAPAGVGEVPHG